jgi:hypothetical protein
VPHQHFADMSKQLIEIVLTVKFRQPNHEFTFGVGMNFISYPLVLPLGITSSFVHVGFGV